MRLVDTLAKAFERATVYSAAAASRASEPALAARFVALLTGDDSMALRPQGVVMKPGDTPRVLRAGRAGG